MIRVNNLSARYNLLTDYVNAVDGVSFEVRDDEIFGIAGESGCGKSTLMKLIYDLIEYPLEITSGSVELVTDVKTFSTGEIRHTWWQNITYVPQGAMQALNPVVTIRKQFRELMERMPNELSMQQNEQRFIDYLHELELSERVMKSYPHQLSGGMRQRVLIAFAAFQNPRLILADEPTTALDVVVQRGILVMLKKVQMKTRNSIILVSHDMGVHYQIADTLGIMYAGQLIETGPTEEIFERPAHPYTKMLINALPRIGDISQKEGIPGKPPSLRNPPVGCRFAERCQYATDYCRANMPQATTVSSRHVASCHLLSNPDKMSAGRVDHV